MFKGRKLNDLLSDKRFIRWAVIAALAAVLAIFAGSLIQSGSGEAQVDTEAFSDRLKRELLNVVSHIDGVGEAEIFLTLDNGGENVYLSHSDTKTKSIEPTVRGVVIVCDGGDDPVVVSRVLSAVTRALSVSSDKVCVTKLARSQQNGNEYDYDH